MTAIYIECKEKNLKLNGSIHVKSKYLGMSISVELIGEEYIITLPSFYTRSIVTKPWNELGGVCSISCLQTGYCSSIEFVLKSFYGEKSNQVNVVVKNKSNEMICKINGEWNGRLEYEYVIK